MGVPAGIATLAYGILVPEKQWDSIAVSDEDERWDSEYTSWAFPEFFQDKLRKEYPYLNIKWVPNGGILIYIKEYSACAPSWETVKTSSIGNHGVDFHSHVGFMTSCEKLLKNLGFPRSFKDETKISSIPDWILIAECTGPG
jgi:hypothetical protein